MAINTFTGSSDKNPYLPISSLHSSKGSITQNRFVKTNFGINSIATSSNKHANRKNGKPKSPYVNNEKVHLLSRVTEKRLVQKKAADFASSFPLAVNIYKANSDEFKSVKKNRRTKKSVLTLPNEQAPVPQTCTVSDMNDSEDLSNSSRKKKTKKRSVGQNRRSRNDFEFYDRDARYCSQFNIHLGCSSTDVIRNFNNDENENLIKKKQHMLPKTKDEQDFKGHDVWRVLRNINRFQFRPSPPMSDEDILLPRKKGNKMRFNRKDTRFFETCRTEEIAYISSIEIDSKSPTFSPSSSFDRVTVIDKKGGFTRICEEFEKNIVKPQNVAKNTKTQKNNRNKNKSVTKKTFKTFKKDSGSKECEQSTLSKGIEFKQSYENNAIGVISTYSISNANEDSLTCNAHVDDGERNEYLGNLVPVGPTANSTDYTDTLVSLVKTVSSKTAVQGISKGHNKGIKISEETSNPPVTGITKVVLSKGQDIVLSKRLATQKKKPRLATTLTTATIIPKLTQTDIRRRLLNMKFPVVILGKDQVSSTIEVMDSDPPQFQGLDKHIWPFMIEWSDNCSKLKMELGNISSSKDMLSFDPQYDENSFIQKSKFCHTYGDHKFNNMQFETNRSKQPKKKDQKYLNGTKLFSNKPNRNPETLPMDIIKEAQQTKKAKPIRQLRDKVLKLLYKKQRVLDVSEDLNSKGKCDLKNEPNGCNTNKTDVSAVIAKINNINDPLTRRNLRPSNSILMDNSPEPMKRPWARAKWASDFIDNVIKKIKNGVYYNQDLKHEHQKPRIAAVEVCVQTKSSLENTNDTESAQLCDQLLIKRNEILTGLPGFDNSLPELEVQTLGINKIEIKNCLTNIIVQFDIAVPKESDKLNLQMKKSCSLIPLEKSNSNFKLFKCKATILNAMLPAELCTILPNMMREIVQADNTKLCQTLPINKTDSQLSTISESSHYEGLDCFKSISKLSKFSPEVRLMLLGKFPQSIKNQKIFQKVKNIAFHSSQIKTMAILPQMPDKILLPLVVIPMENIFKSIEYKKSTQQANNNVCEINNSICQKLQPYNSQTHSLIPAGESYSPMRILRDIWTAYMKNGGINFCPSIRACTISLHLREENMTIKNVVVNFGNAKLDSIFENYANIKNEYNSKTSLNELDYLPTQVCESAVLDGEAKTDKKINKNHSSNHKVKRKGFIKLYKKCKSTTNIPNEKSSLLLTKIITLDDFFQLLGSKSLCCVFDGNSGKKILSSIVTMKNWITEISSRQAILVLLLANKKDTPNLIRFRPVLLQGIAVNRITRASELDMEIEVIERENLNVVSQFEGICYVPASTENKDNLLEELNWIAKTTASDYQKPFDESSEKLLKSLLEKRKKLNPSYLRVMARYVGLGLLKSPSKK